MADVTRRGFLAQTAIATGVGVTGALGLHQFVLPRIAAGSPAGNLAAQSVASAGATGPLPTGGSLSAPSLTSLSLGGLSLAEPLVIHVRDLQTAEISVMVGTQELVYRDPELVSRLVMSAGSAIAEA